MHNPYFQMLLIVLVLGLVLGLSLIGDSLIPSRTLVFERDDVQITETSPVLPPPATVAETTEENVIAPAGDVAGAGEATEDEGSPEDANEIVEESFDAAQDDSVESPVEIIEPSPQVTFSDINLSTREAIVNILCTTNAMVPFGSISGSGVMLNSSGIILTNAHIAQYYLLKDYPIIDGVSCVVRTGSPARNKYTAELLYISPVWIEEHSGDIIKERPTGTGENDFALLRITGRTLEGGVLPETFAYVEPQVSDGSSSRDQNVLIAGYPAGFLGGISIQKTLYAVSTIVQIKEIFTFSTDFTDLISFGGNIAAQQGVSGSAIVDENNKLIGIVVTSTDGETTEERDLRALTLSHIDRSLKKDTGSGLLELLSGDAALKSALFMDTKAPALTDILIQAIE